MKRNIKKKAGPKRGPGYRTADHFKGSKFSGAKRPPRIKFNPAQFKVQHKG